MHCRPIAKSIPCPHRKRGSKLYSGQEASQLANLTEHNFARERISITSNYSLFLYLWSYSSDIKPRQPSPCRGILSSQKISALKSSPYTWTIEAKMSFSRYICRKSDLFEGFEGDDASRDFLLPNSRAISGCQGAPAASSRVAGDIDYRVWHATKSYADAPTREALVGSSVSSWPLIR